jgi:diguanylate cyclase (GGDEF)-like protein
VRVAAAIRKEARGSDAAFRIGGDEFLVLLDSASSAGAVAVAYRLTDTVAASALAALAELGLKQRIPVTCSIGVASYPANGESPAELIRAADAAAYEAKRAGRDQVRIAETP